LTTSSDVHEIALLAAVGMTVADDEGPIFPRFHELVETMQATEAMRLVGLVRARRTLKSAESGDLGLALRQPRATRVVEKETWISPRC